MRIIIPFFDVIIRKNKEIIFVLPHFPNDPYQTPIFAFNRKDIGVLYRDETQDIVFTYFDKEVVEVINNAEFITFVELDKDQNVIFSYVSAVTYDAKLKK